jgi:hypothetical protein
MTLHKLNPERQPPEPRHINVGVSFQHELYNLADTVVNTRALQAFEMAVTNHPGCSCVPPANRPGSGKTLGAGARSSCIRARGGCENGFGGGYISGVRGLAGVQA